MIEEILHDLDFFTSQVVQDFFHQHYDLHWFVSRSYATFQFVYALLGIHNFVKKTSLSCLMAQVLQED